MEYVPLTHSINRVLSSEQNSLFIKKELKSYTVTPMVNLLFEISKSFLTCPLRT